MKPRITLRDIADRAGVHFTTVSRALRNHPGIPADTRATLKKLAQEMGYSPDPMVSALNAYRLAKQRVTYHGVIAWLDGYPNPDELLKREVHLRLFNGARQRAAEMGYSLESFWLGGETQPDMRKIERTLAARNIRNLIVAPQFSAQSHIQLHWDRYSAIAASFSLGSPRLHLVTHDQFANIVLMMRKLSEKGYRRIGILLDQRLIQITGRRWLSGYLIEREKADPADRMEYLVFEPNVSKEVILDWYHRNKPDAIITDREFWTNRLEAIFGSTPRSKVGIALVSIDHGNPFAGIVESSERIGACSVEQLVHMEHNDERGIPAIPQRIFIEGVWKDGTSARRK